MHQYIMTLYLIQYSVCGGKNSKNDSSDLYPCIDPSPLSMGGISKYDEILLLWLCYTAWRGIAGFSFFPICTS